MLGFSGSVLLVGGLLLGASALSGWLRGTVLSVSVLAVAAGIGLSVTGVLDIAPDEPWLSEVIEVALILTLFADGLTAERVLVRRSWHDPLRALLLAMPLTLVAIASREGAVRRVELGRGAAAGRRVGADRSCGHVDGGHERACPGGGPKHTELESGLNDGLALPFVLVFLVVAQPGGDAAASAGDVALESVAGAVIGAARCGVAARPLARRSHGGAVRGVYSLGIALIAFGLAGSTIGKGLVATFVAALALGAAREELPDAFTHFNAGRALGRAPHGRAPLNDRHA